MVHLLWPHSVALVSSFLGLTVSMHTPLPSLSSLLLSISDTLSSQPAVCILQGAPGIGSYWSQIYQSEYPLSQPLGKTGQYNSADEQCFTNAEHDTL